HRGAVQLVGQMEAERGLERFVIEYGRVKEARENGFALRVGVGLAANALPDAVGGDVHSFQSVFARVVEITSSDGTFAIHPGQKSPGKLSAAIYQNMACRGGSSRAASCSRNSRMCWDQ